MRQSCALNQFAILAFLNYCLFSFAFADSEQPFDTALTVCAASNMSEREMHEALVTSSWIPLDRADLPDEVLVTFTARGTREFAGSTDASAFRSQWRDLSSKSWQNRLMPDQIPSGPLRIFYLHNDTMSLLNIASASPPGTGRPIGVNCSIAARSAIVPDWLNGIVTETKKRNSGFVFFGPNFEEQNQDAILEASILVFDVQAVQDLVDQEFDYPVIWSSKYLLLEEE